MEVATSLAAGCETGRSAVRRLCRQGPFVPNSSEATAGSQGLTSSSARGPAAAKVSASFLA